MSRESDTAIISQHRNCHGVSSEGSVLLGTRSRSKGVNTEGSRRSMFWEWGFSLFLGLF